MDFRAALVCLIIVTGVVSEELDADGVHLTIDISASRVHVGDSVSMVCRVENVPSEAYIYWFKSVIGWDGVDHLEMVALSVNPLPPYDRMSRFSLTETSNGQNKLYTLRINKTEVEDSGHWGCSYKEVTNNLYETELFEVYDGVDEVYVEVNNKTVDNDVIMTVANEPVQLKVYAGRTVPVPFLAVYVDKVDISQTLKHTSQSHMECPPKGSLKNCSLHYSMSTAAVGMYTFDGNHDLSTLDVQVGVPGSGFQIFNKTYKLQIDHWPLFRCLTQQGAKRNQPFTLKCTVNARPSVDVIYWLMRYDEKEYYVFPNQTEIHFNAVAAVQRVDEMTVDVSLTFHNVTEMQYTTFDLWAGNKYDNKTVSMTLFEDFSPPTGPNSASLLVTNVAVLLVSSLASLIV